MQGKAGRSVVSILNVRFAPIAAQCTLTASESGSSGAWPQPPHDHVVRRSAAERQAVPFDRGFCKSQCLAAGLSFLARKCHPLANNGASCLRLDHLDFLLRLFRSSDGALRRLKPYSRVMPLCRRVGFSGGPVLKLIFISCPETKAADYSA